MKPQPRLLGNFIMAILEKINQVLNTDLTQVRFKKKPLIITEPLTFIEQLKQRRSIYDLGKRIHVSQQELTTLIQSAVECCPTPVNSKTTSIVIMMGPTHEKLWQVIFDNQKRHTPDAMRTALEEKIQSCSAAYGTVLFYEDQQIIQQLQKQYPFKAERYPLWSEQTSGMAQYAVWVALANLGLGASLQHYNPYIDADLAEEFALPVHWQLKAQLVFGSIESMPEPHEQSYMPQRVKIFT